MSTQLLHKLTWKGLLDFLYKAKDYIFVSLPSVDDELAQCFENILENRELAIFICVDNSEKTIRDGYGDSSGIRRILNKGIFINESPGNRVSFIISELQGFIVFPESKIFSQDPAGYNAIAIDNLLCMRLIRSYFPQKDEAVTKAIKEVIESEFDLLEATKERIIQGNDDLIATEPFKKEEFKKIEQAIAQNPVEQPDLQRQIRTYTTKVQFVEMQFKGGKIENTLVKFPDKALPIKDEKFRQLLSARIKLINNEKFLEENEDIKKLILRVEALRKEFLTPITCREGKSILFKEKKAGFQKELESIQNDIELINLDIPQIVRTALETTKKAVEETLINYYIENPLEDHKRYKEGEARNKRVKNYVQPFIDILKPSGMSKLNNHYNLITNYYDLTWEDFKDEKLLSEFVKKGILNKVEEKEIVDMKQAFQVKK